MSMTAARAYFRARGKAIGLKEWTDGFNSDNIPSSVIHKSFHIQQGVASGISLNQNDQVIEFPITVKIFVKGYKDPSSGIDSAIELTENLIEECLTPQNRLTQSNGIKTIIYESSVFDPLSDSNDNAVIASSTFRVMTILGL